MVEERAPSAGEPRRRVVLLGASNVARGLSAAVESARLAWNEPVEILAAIGHGRSYGFPSSVLGRKLPGIIACGVWSALAQRPALPGHAIVTDVGNDLLYGVPVEQIVQWVETCLDRLETQGCQIMLTGLPLESLGKLSRWRYSLLKAGFFPGRPLSLAQAMQLGQDLDARLQEVADARKIPLFRPQLSWYGWDPIHIKLRFGPLAWQRYFSIWSGAESQGALARGSLARWFRLIRLAPEYRQLWGREQHCAQPAARLCDGTTISLY